MRSILATWPMGLLFVALGISQTASVGWAPTSSALIAAGADLSAPLAAPRAFGLHAGALHAFSNAVLLLLFAMLWGRLAVFVRPAPRVELGPLALALVAGPVSLALSAALDGAPRVGASGGVNALLGGLPVLAFSAHRALPGLLPAATAWAVTGLCVALLALGATLPVNVDALSHLIGFALGAAMSRLALRPYAALALGTTAAAWWVAAVLVL